MHIPGAWWGDPRWGLTLPCCPQLQQEQEPSGIWRGAALVWPVLIQAGLGAWADVYQMSAVQLEHRWCDVNITDNSIFEHIRFY